VDKDDKDAEKEFKSAFDDIESKSQVKNLRKTEGNRVRGNLGMRVVSFNDQDDSSLDYRQFGVHSRLRVERLFNTPLEFGFRWRSRAHQRERELTATQAEDNWTHSLYEFGLTYHDPTAPVEFSAGRILSPYIRGVGYIDGGLFVYRLHHNWRFGVTGGLQPNLSTSSLQSEHRKFGTFVNYTAGDYQTRRFSSSVAFSGSYRSGDVSREFVYWQNTFNAGSGLSLYQTVEFDMNRAWRKDSTGTSLQMSNLFLSASYAPWKSVNFTLSYDARKQLRTFETRSIPDSLFDEAMRRGLRGGITIRLASTISLTGNAGVRFGRDGLGNTMSAGSALNFRRFFGTRASLSTRLSYFSTMFSSAYRPNVYVSLPVMRKIRTYISVGGYLYDTGGRTTKNWWSELGGTWYTNGLLYVGFGYKNYWQGQLVRIAAFLPGVGDFFLKTRLPLTFSIA
jgi:hypothetical protein